MIELKITVDKSEQKQKIMSEQKLKIKEKTFLENKFKNKQFERK